jgi:hypothetical protein
MPMPPAIQLGGTSDLEAVLAGAEGRPFTLLSPEGAAGSMGPRLWLAIAARAPGLPNLLCCGAAPGHALAALRAGCRGLVLRHPPVSLQAAAAELDATLLTARPPALVLDGLDLRRPAARARLLTWLRSASPDDSGATLG